ncbi:MAG: GGDEF domain-containing protein [Oleiphilus sp.]
MTVKRVQLDKLALGILLFLSTYHAFSLLIDNRFGVSLLFIFSAAFAVRLLVNKGFKTSNLEAAYLMLFALVWASFFLLLFHNLTNIQHSASWLCLVIISASMLLPIRTATKLNGALLIVFWLLAIFYANYADGFIETALVLSLVCLIAAIIQQQFSTLLAQLAVAKTTDRITGCIQSDAFDTELNKVIQLYERYQTPFSLISIKCQSAFDAEADKNIWFKELAQLYQSRLRKTDILCRYTSESFVALLPSTSDQNLDILSADLERCAHAYQFSYQASSDSVPNLAFSAMTYTNKAELSQWLHQH